MMGAVYMTMKKMMYPTFFRDMGALSLRSPSEYSRMSRLNMFVKFATTIPPMATFFRHTQ